MNFKRKASLLMAMVFIVNSLSVALATDTGIPQINEDNTTSGQAIITDSGTASSVESDRIGIDFSVLNDWGSGYSAQIVISNNSDTELKDWKLLFDFNYGIDSLWNGTITEHTDNHYVVSNAGYNSVIGVGNSVTIGFNGSPGLVNETPKNYILQYQDGEYNKVTDTETSTEITTESNTETTTGGSSDDAGEDSGNNTWESPAVENVFDFALFTGSSAKGIGLYTNSTHINGDVHSNEDFYFQGNILEIDGICETVGKINANTSDSSGSYINDKVEHTDMREMAQLAGYAYDYLKDKADVYNDWHNFNQGNVELNNSVLCEQGVQFNTSTFVGRGTVYAKDGITYNVGSLATADDSKVFLVSENGDIVINGSDIEMNGILYASNGVVRINAGNFRLNGRIIADRFEFNGTTLHINKGDSDLDFIKWLFAPDITLNVSGEYKVNRKVVLDISESNEINRISKENVVWEITDENGEVAVTAVDEENSDNFKKELLFKKAGKYTVKVYTGFEEQVITKEI